MRTVTYHKSHSSARILLFFLMKDENDFWYAIESFLITWPNCEKIVKIIDVVIWLRVPLIVLLQ